MARRSSRTSSRRGAAKEAAPRQPRTKSKKSKAAASPADVEVVEEAGGEGIDSAVIIATTIALLAAFVCTDMLLSKFDEGMFF